VPIIHNVVIHINNEQPVLVDLLAEPKASDSALICRNVRSLSGKKPVFVNASESTFVIPLSHVTSVEIPQASLEAFAAENATFTAEAAETARTAMARIDAEYSDLPLARLAWLTGEGEDPGVDAAGSAEAGESESPPANPDDLDDDLLRRIREI
jgi:hypothetical protein